MLELFLWAVVLYALIAVRLLTGLLSECVCLYMCALVSFAWQQVGQVKLGLFNRMSIFFIFLLVASFVALRSELQS